jgi:hypothetical protein
MVKRLLALAALGAAALAATAAAAQSGANTAGFHTSVPSMLDGRNGATTQPIISVGDTLPGGYTFESIPDGISFSNVNGNGTADILVNHELSLVGFPLPTATAPGRIDFTNSMVSKLRLQQHSAGVLKGDVAIPSSANYQRFCSNFVVGPAQGFERELLLTNEEARDIVRRTGEAWTPAGVSLSEPSAEQAGVVVAYDVKSGEYRSIYGMGRHNHENDVGVPGYGHPVVLSGDDTFDAPASQLYLYSAPSGADLWNDTEAGKLYVFVSDNPAKNDYGDVVVGDTVPAHFVEVPRAIATGKVNGREATSADFGFPAPPSAAIPNGPQWVLEYWSQNVAHAFQFIRVEDIAYDRTHSNVVYFADTGEPRALPDPATGVLRRGPSGTTGPYPNGRLFKIVLGSSDPLAGAQLSILPGANFDAATPAYGNPGIPHQPDNVETTPSAIYFQEDPGSHQQFAGATNARVWRYDLATGGLSVVAEVNQGLAPGLRVATWESSGIVDASAVFGPGTFLLDVQAHQLELNVAPAFPNFEYRREGGQLLLLKVPGETGSAVAAAPEPSRGAARGER